MFYKLEKTVLFDGEKNYIDITSTMQHFIHNSTFSFKCIFKTKCDNYMTILSAFFKETFIPDFAICLNKGYFAIYTKINNKNIIINSAEAFNDEKEHTLTINMQKDGLKLYVDNAIIIENIDIYPFCQFNYIGFINIGRGVLLENFDNYFKGTLRDIYISNTPFNIENIKQFPNKTKLFYNGMDNITNYRIPNLISLPNGTLIASVDARIDANGDNPNHIARAIKISKDNGETWSKSNIICDFGGYGREDGASAIDGSLLYDDTTSTLFMIFGHTSKNIGTFVAKKGTGFNKNKEKILIHKNGQKFSIDKNNQIIDKNKTKTNYFVNSIGTVFENNIPISSICYGNDRLFKQEDTSFLKMIKSIDNGETWSDPIDLNPQIKKDFMKFIGPSPGIGIKLKNGKYKGRLIYPIYYSNEHSVFSSAIIYSDDNGHSWNIGASVNDGRIFNGEKINSETITNYNCNLGECQVTEIENGNIKIFLRTSFYKKIATAVSVDGGETFGQISIDENTLDCECQSSIIKIDYNGKSYHILTNPHNEKSRRLGQMKISDNNTSSWRYTKTIENGDFAYSCMTLLKDDTIGVLYEGIGVDIFFKKIKLADLKIY